MSRNVGLLDDSEECGTGNWYFSTVLLTLDSLNLYFRMNNNKNEPNKWVNEMRQDNTTPLNQLFNTLDQQQKPYRLYSSRKNSNSNRLWSRVLIVFHNNEFVLQTKYIAIGVNVSNIYFNDSKVVPGDVVMFLLGYNEFKMSIRNDMVYYVCIS